MLQSHEQVTRTNQVLDRMVGAMKEIGKASGKISRIIKVIDEIAFQTNILALNAAVEAARAGEAGMGFGVVADEVRNLAQRCAEAARDTAGLIEESVARSREAQETVDQVASGIRSIARHSDEVRSLVAGVSAGSQEQARAIEQVAQAIVQMEQLNQGTAATAEEGAAAAEELSAQSQTLRKIVGDLTSVISGTVAAV